MLGSLPIDDVVFLKLPMSVKDVVLCTALLDVVDYLTANGSCVPANEYVAVSLGSGKLKKSLGFLVLCDLGVFSSLEVSVDDGVVAAFELGNLLLRLGNCTANGAVSTLGETGLLSSGSYCGIDDLLVSLS